MKQVTVLEGVPGSMMREVAKIEFYGLRIQQPDGTTRVPLASAGELEEREVRCVKGDGKLSEDQLGRIIMDLEFGKAIGDIDDDLHWRCDN